MITLSDVTAYGGMPVTVYPIIAMPLIMIIGFIWRQSYAIKKVCVLGPSLSKTNRNIGLETWYFSVILNLNVLIYKNSNYTLFVM